MSVSAGKKIDYLFSSTLSNGMKVVCCLLALVNLLEPPRLLRLVNLPQSTARDSKTDSEETDTEDLRNESTILTSHRYRSRIKIALLLTPSHRLLPSRPLACLVLTRTSAFEPSISCGSVTPLRC